MVNIITGRRVELVPVLAGHRDVNAIDLTGCVDDVELLTRAEAEAADSVTRVVKARTVWARLERRPAPRASTR